jgi:hypothetical protein
MTGGTPDYAQRWQLLRTGRIVLVGSGRRIGRRRCTVRGCRHRLRAWRVGTSCHGALGIQQMVLARSQTQFDQRARVRHRLALPAVICLVAAHGLFARLIPGACRFSAHVMLADEGFLNRLRPLGVDFLLSTHTGGLLSRRMFSCRRSAEPTRGFRRSLFRRTSRRFRGAVVMLLVGSSGCARGLLRSRVTGRTLTRSRRWEECEER